MNIEQFWKIIYLYVIKYNYDILYYKSDKNDIWLIDENNEVIRFIYTEKLRMVDVDSSVYNIINNESKLKKVFKLSSLKVKVLHVSRERDTNIQEYRKYRISDELLVERVIISDKNKLNFIKNRDEKFIDYSMYNKKYKERIEAKYNKNENPYNINFYMLSMFLCFIILFLTNYSLLYFKDISIYSYLDYNYQAIISGELYRLISDVFIFNNINQLFLISFTGIFITIFFGQNIGVIRSMVLISMITMLFNVFRLFKFIDSISVISLAVFALLASILSNQYMKKSNNTKMMYAVVVVSLYFILTVISIPEKKVIILYIIAFLMGAIFDLIRTNRIVTIVSTATLTILLVSSVIIRVFSIDIKTPINNYRYSMLDTSSVGSSEKLKQLEQELGSKNKSVLTYYELASLGMVTTSKEHSKKILEEALQFDNTFAPIYYELALIEYSLNNSDKAEEYINRAIELDATNSKYIQFKEEI